MKIISQTYSIFFEQIDVLNAVLKQAHVASAREWRLPCLMTSPIIPFLQRNCISFSISIQKTITYNLSQHLIQSCINVPLKTLDMPSVQIAYTNHES